MTTQEEFSEKFKKLPPHIQEIMLSPQTAETNGDIAEKYKLDGEKIREMVNIIVHIIFKEIPLENLVNTLQQKLKMDIQTTRQMALDIVEKRFLPLGDYLQGTKALIQNLSKKTPMPQLKSSPISSDEANIVDLKNKEKKQEE